MKKSKSSARWLNDHENDEFVRRAKRDGYRSRAAYKLLEIQEKYRILKPGGTVVDLGAAPGGWMQVAASEVGDSGFVVGLDLLETKPLSGCTFLQGDFTEDAVLEQLAGVLGGRPVDLVISDMAPNISGVKDIDQPRAMYLVELAVGFAVEALRPGGAFLAKCFEGEGIDDIRRVIRSDFKQLDNVKPRASRGGSREIYLLGRGFRESRV